MSIRPACAFTVVIRRCSHRPSRYRWTIISVEGRAVEYATESYATSQAAIEAGESRAASLNRRSALGYDVG